MPGVFEVSGRLIPLKIAPKGVAKEAKFTYSSPQKPDKYISISLVEAGVVRRGPN
jgi:hypothetical protein